MSTQTEIARILGDRNTIRTKLVELGMATNTDNLTKLADAIEGLINRGAISVTVQEGDTYTIPAGYHNGSGTVSGVAGGGNYNLQSKSATPTKKQQSVTPDSGFYGLSDVTIAPIPDNYQDVSSVDAVAGDVLTGKIFVAADGTIITGSMVNNGTVSKTLDVTTISYTIPKGYHSGTGKVTITLEQKSVTPTKAQQVITPTAGKVLSSVTVAPIPDEYITTGDATATADKILYGESAYVGGSKVVGSIPNNGTVTKTLDTTNTSQAIAKGYHTGEGNVSITLETKSATPTKSAQTVTPSTGKVLSSVSVAAIPAAYQDVTAVTAAAGDVLDGKKIVDATGNVVEGSIPVNGAITGSIDGLTTTSYAVPAGYTTGGTVSLTSDIEDALAAI